MYYQSASIGLNPKMLPVFLGLLLVSAVAWLYLSRRLYEFLAQNYPVIYEKLGSPTLLMEKSMVTNYRVMLFILRREYVSVADEKLRRLCQGLQYIFYIYVVCLLGCLLLLAHSFF